MNPDIEAAVMQAAMNIKQIGRALTEFKSVYGSYPSDATRKILEDTIGVKFSEDDKTSNSSLSQILAAGFVENEEVFFAPISGVKKHSNSLEKNKLLAAGENAFTYIAGPNKVIDPIKSEHSERPLLVCPLISESKKFDPKPFKGKALILCIDLTVKLLKIEDDGRVMKYDADLLSKENEVWKNLEGELDIRYPDLLPKE